MRTVRYLAILIGLMLATGVMAISDLDVPFDRKVMAGQKDNFLARPPDYFKGYVHIGVDLMVPLGTNFRSVVDGTIVYCSPTGWGPGNMAYVIRSDEPRDGQFCVVEGHAQRPVINGKVLTDNEVRSWRIGERVWKGESLGVIGQWLVNGAPKPHLHLGVYYNPTHPGEVPKDNLGMLNETKGRIPDAVINGIPSIANWWDPLVWLSQPRVITSGVDNYLPTTCPDGGFYFIRDDASGQQVVMLSDANANVTVSVGKLPTGEVATAMSAGPNNGVLVKTSGPDGCSLWAIGPKASPRRLVLSSSDFDFGSWSGLAEYTPFQTGAGWKAVNLKSGLVQEPGEVLPADGLAWELIGSTTHGGTTKSQITRWVVEPHAANESVLLDDSTAQLSSSCMLPAHQDDVRGIIWVRRDMAGSSIWRSVLCQSALSFFGVGMGIANDSALSCVYRTRNEILSCCIVGSEFPAVVFDEQIDGRFVIRVKVLYNDSPARDLIR